MNPFYKNLALWLVITLMMVMLYNLFNQQQLSQNDISYSEFLAMVEADRVAEVTIQGQEIRVTDLNRSHFKIYAPQDPALIQRLKDKGVTIISATHDLKMLQRSDRILWIDDGRIVKADKPSNIDFTSDEFDDE